MIGYQKTQPGSRPPAKYYHFDEQKQIANQSQINTGEECRGEEEIWKIDREETRWIKNDGLPDWMVIRLRYILNTQIEGEVRGS